MSDHSSDKNISIEINAEQLHVLQHSLGVDQYGQGDQYRNRFFTDENTPDWAICSSLCDLGLMKNVGPQSLADGMHLFVVTDLGKEVMKAKSPSPPKISRSRQRYLDYLNEDSYMTFGEWLKLQKFKST